MSKVATKISPKDRVNEFGKDRFHCDGAILFCSTCNKAVDHIRRQSIVDHLSCAKHKDSLKRKADICIGQTAKKQRTVHELFEQQSSNKKQASTLVRDFVSMCVEANIPIEKADHPSVREFLATHVRGGGVIPKASQLRTAYLPALIKAHEDQLHELINGNSHICIITDQTTDVKNRPVLNILIQLLLPIEKIESDIENLKAPLLVKTVFLEKVNHATVSQAVLQCCAEFSIDFGKIMLFVSDSTSYMVKAWKCILSAVWINCHHMHCLAHVVALAGNAFRLSLPDVDRCVAVLKSALV